MFNFGITEIMVIAVIGLVVIGPERLPKVARTLGHMFSRMQRYVSDVKSDISKEMQLEELKAMQKSMKVEACLRIRSLYKFIISNSPMSLSGRPD